MRWSVLCELSHKSTLPWPLVICPPCLKLLTNIIDITTVIEMTVWVRSFQLMMIFFFIINQKYAERLRFSF